MDGYREPRDHLRSDAPNEHPDKRSKFKAKEAAKADTVLRTVLEKAVSKATSRKKAKSAEGNAKTLMAIFDLEMKRISEGYLVALKSAKDVASRAGKSRSTVHRALRFFAERNVVKTVAGHKGGRRISAGRRIDFAELARWLSEENGPLTEYLEGQLRRLAAEHPIVDVPDKPRAKPARKTQNPRQSDTLCADDLGHKNKGLGPHGSVSYPQHDLTACEEAKGGAHHAPVTDPSGTSTVVDFHDYWRRHAAPGRSIFTIRAMATRDGVVVPDLKPTPEPRSTVPVQQNELPSGKEKDAIRSAFDDYYSLSPYDPDAWA